MNIRPRRRGRLRCHGWSAKNDTGWPQVFFGQGGELSFEVRERDGGNERLEFSIQFIMGFLKVVSLFE